MNGFGVVGIVVMSVIGLAVFGHGLYTRWLVVTEEDEMRFRLATIRDACTHLFFTESIPVSKMPAELEMLYGDRWQACESVDDFVKCIREEVNRA